jgi:osmoprotectant transport system permease protein
MSDFDLLTWVWNRVPELWTRTGEHLVLTGISTTIAVLIGIPLGIIASKVRWLRGPLLGVIGIFQTIPSLAMLAILLALIGKIGTVPAIIALSLYALLPIARNTLTGLEGVSPEVNEAGTGIGMTEMQQLWMVRLPLATPTIIAGIRTAVVIGVGIATLAAFIGAGGLGQFITRGLALSNTRLILLGAIPAAILALLVDLSIALVQWGLRPTRKSERSTANTILKRVALGQPILLVIFGLATTFCQPFDTQENVTSPSEAKGTISVGTKNFTEQFILGELMALVIEQNTDLRVNRRFNLGGTMICHGALTAGEIDIYPEYTGTALTAVLEEQVIREPEKALKKVSRMYSRKFNLIWLSPFGFNNTYAITVREEDYQKQGWKSISDIAQISSELVAGFTSEFAERPDGYPGLKKAYNLNLEEIIDLDPALMYEAIAKDQVDVICAFATDGRIAAYDLKILEDDKGFFPPYYACPVIRESILGKYPEIESALDKLAGILDDKTMRRLNYQVDEKNKDPAGVAAAFLRSLEDKSK